MSRYIPPSLRNRAAVPVVESVSLDTSKGFPVLGNARIAAMKHSDNLLAERAAAWSEVTRESDVDRAVRLKKESQDLGWENLRQFYYSRPAPKPYIRNDDRYEAYLAEQDYLDALKYDAENPLPHATPIVEEWETRHHATVHIPKQQTMEPVADDEMTAQEIRDRIQFLIKRTRRNGLLREDKDALEKEIQHLQSTLYDSD